MRKEFILYLIGIVLFSFFFGIISPLCEDVIIDNKIVTINKENNDINFINKYGTFEINKSSWSNRKENEIYKDTITYQFLFSTATNEKTINNINKDTNLSKFHICIANTGILIFFILFLFLSILVTIAIFIIYYLFRFFEK